MSDTMLDAGDQRKNKPHHLQALSSWGTISVCSVMYWCYHGAGMGALRGWRTKVQYAAFFNWVIDGLLGF